MRLFGHPVHPMLVHFPVAFWTLAAGAYVAGDAGLDERANWIAKLADGAGLAVAITAIAAGLMELRTIGAGSDALRVATLHMMIMASAWILFLLALVLPLAPALDGNAAKLIASASAVVGFLLMSVGGWLGGRLVYTFGIGVKSRAAD